MWCVYMLLSNTSHLTYIGSTCDVKRRIKQHNGLIRGGAKATRRDRPWTVVHVVEGLNNRSEAQRLECVLKRLSHRERLALIK